MLVLVVGPSGAGKDTMLDLARQALRDDPRFRFVRRAITRPSQAGGEDHEALSPVEFAGRDFALRWHAHGLDYGIPADIIQDLQHGIVVIANVSRGIITEAAARFPVIVVVVTAPPAVLARRLAARGRETASDMAERLARDVAVPDHIATKTIMNDATPTEAADRFISILIRAAAPAPQS